MGFSKQGRVVMSVEKRIDKKSGKIIYMARVSVGKDITGKYKYITESFDTKKEASKYNDDQQDFRNNTFSDNTISNKTLVSIVWNDYVKFLSEKMKDNTVVSYKSKFNKWIEPELGNFQIGNINLITIQNFKHRIEDLGASPSTTSYCLKVLKSFLDFSSSGLKKYIIDNPMKYYDMPIIESVEKVKYLKKDDANKFFQHAIGTTYHHLLIFMVNTGLRISEAAALKASDFDFEAGIVTVNHNLSLYVPKRNEPTLEASARVLSTPKSHERRSIALSPMAIRVAKMAIVSAQGNHFIFFSNTEPRKVITKRGVKPTIVETKYLLVRAVYDHVKMICKRAMVINVGPHGLRHTFAANFLMNGGSLHGLSRTLGHASIQSTEIYSHLSQEFLRISTSIVNFGSLEESQGTSNVM